MKDAIILAAGKGSRLRPTLADDLPKGALPLNGIAMVERSVQALLKVGITRIWIGTGHAKQWYEALAQKYPQITCIENPDYATTGSMHTLAQIVPQVKNDVILLESDLIYEDQVLKVVADRTDEALVLSTPYRIFGDEVFLTLGQNDRLLNWSKQAPSDIEDADVLAGISLLGGSTLSKMLALYQKAGTKKMDYEDALVAVSNDEPVYVMRLHDALIMEIDDAKHFELAKKMITELKSRNEAVTPTRKILLNPGPATTSERVKKAQIVADICPREAEFNRVVSDVKTMISALASETPETLETVLFSGSGTAAVESMVSSVTGPDDHLLICDQGAYGDRMVAMAEAHQLHHTVWRPDPLKALSIAELTLHLTQNKITHLAIVHHETSTGLLNDLTQIGQCTQLHDVTLCVDAMSSFAAVDIDMNRDHVQFLCASSNKNIQGMAGISFVITQKEALNTIKFYPKRTVYLDLYKQHEFLNQKGQCQFTPPVQCFYALREALYELREEGGAKARYARYKHYWNRLTACMESLGFEHIIDKSDHGALITAFKIPETMAFSFDEFHDTLYRQHITIYPGKVGTLNTFRLSTIGDLKDEDIDQVIATVQQYFC